MEPKNKQNTAMTWFDEQTSSLTGKLIETIQESCQALNEVPLEMARAVHKSALRHALEVTAAIQAAPNATGADLAQALRDPKTLETALAARTGQVANTAIAKKKTRKTTRRKKTAEDRTGAHPEQNPAQTTFDDLTSPDETQAPGQTA